MLFGLLNLFSAKSHNYHGYCGDDKYLTDLFWKYDDGNNTLTISGKSNMANYNSIKLPPWWKYEDQIKTIIIKDGAKNIGDNAFSCCGNLTSITIPDSVTSIGEYAFCDCKSLIQIKIPNSVTSIGGHAFENCTSLKEIKLPAALKEIDEGAFLNCKSLKIITLPNSVTYIGDRAFKLCESLKEIKILGYITSIGYGVFKWCKKLKKIYYKAAVDFPVDVKTVLRSADLLVPCYQLIAGDNVKILSEPIFVSDDDKYYAGKIKLSDSFGRTVEVEIAAGIFEGFKFTAKGADTFKIDLNLKKLIWKLDDSTLTVGGITEIKTFSNETISLETIRKIVIAEGVEKISERAFISCKNVNEVIIPDSVTTIGDLAFTVSFCGNSAVNDGKNVFWCLEDGILILKKNPIEKDINADFSIGAVSWQFVNENIRGFKLESGIVPNKTFLDWFIQRSKPVRF